MYDTIHDDEFTTDDPREQTLVALCDSITESIEDCKDKLESSHGVDGVDAMRAAISWASECLSALRKAGREEGLAMPPEEGDEVRAEVIAAFLDCVKRGGVSEGVAGMHRIAMALPSAHKAFPTAMATIKTWLEEHKKNDGKPKDEQA